MKNLKAFLTDEWWGKRLGKLLPFFENHWWPILIADVALIMGWIALRIIWNESPFGLLGELLFVFLVVMFPVMIIIDLARQANKE